ncbi:hypothetical protein ISF_08875 [Cordyceps fumosorosea ARSEF 2679]|uniref:Uncharacterized protein n=1 Tax=Cordyceps fumosorosea (strain ARSEF 2679) TaxID=1081104 RepID=A0A167LMF2_CORFA|nr:hypothetical protein ISF_08875 [Cordyceps fumosorosea ARSEF 2679]OAA53261.1 hypothetical protein ISF_08875 [Cordyceps fumosorosea ARSEF 2679]
MYEVARNFVESHQNGKDTGRMVRDADFDMVYQGITTSFSSFDTGEQLQQLDWNSHHETISMQAANELDNWFEHSQRLQSLFEDIVDP